MDRIIHCDKEKDKELALAALTWVAKAKRPLTVAEIRDALSIDSNSKILNPRRRPYLTSILRVCARLLIVEKNTSIVRLVHFTAQEYLDIYLTQGHTDIARLLLKYLVFDNLETPHGALDSSGTRGSYDLERAPLIAYAGYFLDHAELAKRNMETDIHSLRDIIITFLGQPRNCTPLRWYARKVDGRSPWFFRGWPTSASPLWVAASANLVEIAEHLLAQGASPNSNGFEFVSALGVASYYGHIDMVKLLVKAGARPNAASIDPLQLACVRHHVDIVRILIENKFDVNAAGGWYPSPLESVAPTGWSWRIGHPEIEQLLRDAGAHRRETGTKALRIASENGQLEMVSYLLKNGEHDKGGTALEAAVRGGHIDMAEMLLNKCPNLDVVRCSRAFRVAIEAASRGGHNDMVKMLLDNLDTVKHYSNALTAALEAASRGGHIDIAKMLLDKFADLDEVHHHSDAMTAALERASREGDLDMAKLLLDKGVRPDGRVLGAAAGHGHTAIVGLLLESGAEVNDDDASSWKPKKVSSSLEKAVEHGHADTVRLLLGRQAKFNDRLLHVAVKGGHTDIVHSLKADADPNARSWTGDTALGTAVSAGNKYIVEMLLDHGAKPRSWLVSGDPLVVAASKGNLDIVQHLLGAELYEITSRYFSRALQVASDADQEAIVDFLLQRYEEDMGENEVV